MYGHSKVIYVYFYGPIEKQQYCSITPLSFHTSIDMIKVSIKVFDMINLGMMNIQEKNIHRPIKNEHFYLLFSPRASVTYAET